MKSFLLATVCLLYSPVLLASQSLGSIDESALEEKVLSLEEMVEQHTKAIAINAANIKDLDERVRAIETKPLAFTPPQATAKTAVAFDMPKRLENPDKQIAELQQRFNSLQELKAELDEYEEYENYRSPSDQTVTPQPIPQPGNGSAGSPAIAPVQYTVQYGSVSPGAPSLGSGGTSYATPPVASYGVASSQPLAVSSGPVRGRVRGFLGRLRCFGGPGLANSAPARVQRVSYQQQPSTQYVNTQVANEQRAYYCVDVNGNPVACN